jgi:hypothetical protein
MELAVNDVNNLPPMQRNVDEEDDLLDSLEDVESTSLDVTLPYDTGQSADEECDVVQPEPEVQRTRRGRVIRLPGRFEL